MYIVQSCCRSVRRDVKFLAAEFELLVATTQQGGLKYTSAVGEAGCDLKDVWKLQRHTWKCVVRRNLDLDLHQNLGQDLALSLFENQDWWIFTTILSWKRSQMNY